MTASVAYCRRLFWILLIVLDKVVVEASGPLKLGAVLRTRQDAHIAAAAQFAAQWLNDDDTIQMRIEFVDDGEDDAEHGESKNNDNASATPIEWQIVRRARQLCVPSKSDADRVHVLLGTASGRLNGLLNEVAVEHDVALLTAVESDGPDLWHHVSSPLSVFPSFGLLSAVAALVHHWAWKHVVIVYEDETRLARLRLLLEDDALQGIVHFRLVCVHDADYLAAAKLVAALEREQDPEEPRPRVVLDLSAKQTTAFLLAALQLGMIDTHHWYLLTSLELAWLPMELFRHNHARYVGTHAVDEHWLVRHRNSFNVTIFEQHVRDRCAEKGVELTSMAEALHTFDAVLLVADAAIRLRQASLPAGRFSLVGLIQNSTVTGLTGRPLAANYSQRVLMLGYDGVLQSIGEWNAQGRPSLNVDVSLESRAQWIKNEVRVSDELKPHFRVTTIMERPYVMLKRNHYELTGNARFEGFCIDLLAELAKDLGFTYTVELVADRRYGNDVYGNGTWDGMIGELLRKDADMAVAPLTVNFKRADVVRFTKPFLSLGIAILYKIPSDRQPDLFSFLNPLSVDTWMSILAAIVGLTIGMYCVARTTPYEWNLCFSCCQAHQPHPAASYATASSVRLSNNYSLWNTAWYVLSTMLKGGCDFGPRAVSTRLLGGTWWAFTLIILAAYTANLAAVLTVARPYVPIKSLDDLANQTAIAYGAIRGGSTMQFFQESKIPTHAKMWDYMRTHEVFVKNNGMGVERVLEGGYAYLMESTSLEYEVQQNCELMQIGGVLGSKGYSIALRKDDTEWTERISRQLLLYAKRGLIEVKKIKWWRSKTGSCGGVGSSVKQQTVSLTFYNVAGLFIILGLGMVAGIVIVLVELLIRSWQSSRRERRSWLTVVWEEIRFSCNLLNLDADVPSAIVDEDGKRPERDGTSTPALTQPPIVVYEPSSPIFM